MNERSRRFHVMFVCHANVCRSPMAQRLLESALEARWGLSVWDRWQVSSSGVRLTGQREMDPRARKVMGERGVSEEPLPSRRLTLDAVTSADLILTAERVQRATVVAMMPTAVHRTFTIRQFGRLTQAVPERDLQWRQPRELMEAVLQTRGQLQPTAPELDDIADPIGKPLRDFRVCATTLSESIEAMLAPFAVQTRATAG